jgi:hypothetical protein
LAHESVSDLLELHRQMDQSFLEHQRALLRLDLDGIETLARASCDTREKRMLYRHLTKLQRRPSTGVVRATCIPAALNRALGSKGPRLIQLLDFVTRYNVC